MKKSILVFLFSVIIVCGKTFAQDTMSHCNCYIIADTPSMQPVPFTLGTDATVPPYYYNNVNTSQAIKLPFYFWFYGKKYDTVYIGNKGNITFGSPIYSFSNGHFPAGTDTAMIAPFWCDINNVPLGPDPPWMGEVYYKVYPTRMEVIWSNVTFSQFDADLYNNFKLTISNGLDSTILGGNNVQFCYSAMQWASANSSGGTSGFGGIPAMVGINKGDGIAYAQIGRFTLPGGSFYGIDSLNNGTYWLQNQSYVLNTNVTEKNIPPVIINPDFCDTVGICAWDTAEYTLTFLCAIPGQKAVLSALSPTLPVILCDTSTSGNGIHTIKIKAPTNSLVTGYNTINIKATDNSIPPQTSTYPVVFNVGVCTGVNQISEDNNRFTVYPNPSKGEFTFELNGGQLPVNSTLKVYDIAGREVCSENVTDTKMEVNISEQPAGTYFLKLIRNNIEILVKKISIR